MTEPLLLGLTLAAVACSSSGAWTIYADLEVRRDRMPITDRTALGRRAERASATAAGPRIGIVFALACLTRTKPGR